MAELSMEWKLPKNIRQIGDGGGDCKIYIEDYVMTYLHQLAEKEGERKALLLGTVKERNLFPFVFIDSAIEVDGFHQNDDEKEELRRNIIKNFGSKKIVGWFITAHESPFVMEQKIIDIYKENFSAENQILLVFDKEDDEDFVFLMEEETPVEQPGYYIYYEKNAMMQNYMIASNKGKTVENENAEKDSAIHLFRKLIKEKQSTEKNVNFGRIRYVASGFLVMTILALGITMVYNYDKMRDVEKNLARLTGNVESQIEYVTDEVQPVIMMVDDNAERLKEISDTEIETEKYIPWDETAKKENLQETAETILEETAEIKQTSGGTIRTSYIVKVGDTLAGISEMYYGTLERVEDICALNGIEDENTILPGQKILLP